MSLFLPSRRCLPLVVSYHDFTFPHEFLTPCYTAWPISSEKASGISGCSQHVRTKNNSQILPCSKILRLNFPAWHQGFPGGSDGKESVHNAGDLDPWVGKIPWRREWHSTPVFLPRKFHGQRSLVGYSPGGLKVRHDWATNTDKLSSSGDWILIIMPGAYHSNIHWLNKWTTKSSEREECEGSLWTIRKHFQKNKRQVGCFHKLSVSQIYLNSPFQNIHNCEIKESWQLEDIKVDYQ